MQRSPRLRLGCISAISGAGSLIRTVGRTSMRWRLLALIIAIVAAYDCRAQGTNSLSSLEARLLGTWRWVPAQEDTNAFVKFHLSADRSWSSLVEHNNPLTHPDNQSGTWFVHNRVLVLRVDKTDLRLIEKMAYTFDIESLTTHTLILTNSALGDLTLTQIAQPDGAANRIQPDRPETNRPSAEAGSGR